MTNWPTLMLRIRLSLFSAFWSRMYSLPACLLCATVTIFLPTTGHGMVLDGSVGSGSGGVGLPVDWGIRQNHGWFEDVPLMECMYLVFTRMPGGVTVGDSGFCCCVFCLSSNIVSYYIFILLTGECNLIELSCKTCLQSSWTRSCFLFPPNSSLARHPSTYRV